MITGIGFYIKIKVRSSKLRCKGTPLVIIVILSIIIAALKIGDILTYSLVPFILYIVYRLISRFKTAWAMRKDFVVSMLSLNISGAYDNVPHERLLYILRAKGFPE